MSNNVEKCSLWGVPNRDDLPMQHFPIQLLKGIGGGLRSNFEIFFVLTHLKIWIMCDKNLFTELKNLERRPRYDFAKTGRTHPLSAICKGFSVKKGS